MVIGFICGAWDLLHPGHLYTLHECKRYCDKLVVGLHVDPSKERKGKGKSVQTIFERWLQLRDCKWVDKIIPYESELDLLNILSMGDFDIRFLGEDYLTRKDITGKDIVPIKYIKRNHSYSSSELRNRL
jgi:glycerol-3-phosphate cytidylyltransferase